MISSSSPLAPKAVAIVNDSLAISWEDGTEAYLPLKTLRTACPCALCAGEPDVMGQVTPMKKTLKPESFFMKSYIFVGGYALQFTWGDGHSSGIYSYRYLRGLE